jgi:hypothetical protein
VREKRGIGQDLPPTIDPVSLQAEIFKEYQKEFYCEGQLFYYYKRLNAAYMVDYNNVAGVATPINVPTTGLLVFPVPQKETTLGGR